MSQPADSYQEPYPEGAAISNNRVKIVVVLAVVISAFGYFAFMAFDSATQYYLTVGELNQRGPTEEGRSVRVSGKLVPDSFSREEGSTLAKFVLSDGTERLNAVHDGLLPDLFFNEHSDVILEGRYAPDGTFYSQRITIRCPSKYIAAD